jgi:nucleoside-diphosphate-sugar epimerase
MAATNVPGPVTGHRARQCVTIVPQMRIFVTGGSGVLGRAALPRFERAGHTVVAPARTDLDLFDPDAVRAAMDGAGAIVHLATRIPPPDRFEEPGAWDENDRLRTEASRILVDVAPATADLYLQASIAFVYPPDVPVDESTPIGEIAPPLRSTLDAEAQAQRFGASGRRGVALRFGLLYGPGTWTDGPNPMSDAPLHVDDAGSALELALGAPSGIYNVVADGGRVSNARFKQITGWAPRH